MGGSTSRTKRPEREQPEGQGIWTQKNSSFRLIPSKKRFNDEIKQQKKRPEREQREGQGIWIQGKYWKITAPCDSIPPKKRSNDEIEQQKRGSIEIDDREEALSANILFSSQISPKKRSNDEIKQQKLKAHPKASGAEKSEQQEKQMEQERDREQLGKENQQEDRKRMEGQLEKENQQLKAQLKASEIEKSKQQEKQMEQERNRKQLERENQKLQALLKEYKKTVASPGNSSDKSDPEVSEEDSDFDYNMEDNYYPLERLGEEMVQKVNTSRKYIDAINSVTLKTI